VRQLAAAFAQASLLAVHRSAGLGPAQREQARTRKAAASCRTPKCSPRQRNELTIANWQLAIEKVVPQLLPLSIINRQSDIVNSKSLPLHL